ncbi:hypothetical protein ACFL3C_03595 [Patescibacteria group bacterium]
MKTKNLIKSIVALIVTGALLSLFSYVAIAAFGSQHNHSSKCDSQNCVTWHNNGYSMNGKYKNGVPFATFNGYKDNRSEDGMPFDERQFMYIESEYADHDGQYPAPRSPWDFRVEDHGLQPYNFSQGTSHHINFGNSDEPVYVGFWAYVHNNGVADQHEAEYSRIKITDYYGTSTSHNPKYTLWAQNTKPRIVFADTQVTGSKPFSLNLVEGYYDRESNSPGFADNRKMTQAQLNQVRSAGGLSISSNAQYDNNTKAGIIDSSDLHYMVVYLEFEAVPQDTPECRSLNISFPSDAVDGQSNIFNVPSWESPEGGFSDQIMQIQIDADPGSYTRFQYITPNPDDVKFKRYIADTDLTQNLFTNNQYVYLDGEPDEGDTQYLMVFAVDENDDWVGGSCADAVKIVRPDISECAELNTDPGRSHQYDLMAGEEVDISVDNITDTDGEDFRPEGEVPLLEYCYSGDIDWNWSENNIFPSPGGDEPEIAPFARPELQLMRPELQIAPYLTDDFLINPEIQAPFDPEEVMNPESNYLQVTEGMILKTKVLPGVAESYDLNATATGVAVPAVTGTAIGEAVTSEPYELPLSLGEPISIDALQFAPAIAAVDVESTSLTAPRAIEASPAAISAPGLAVEATLAPVAESLVSPRLQLIPQLLYFNPHCVIAPADQVLNDVVPLEPGTMTIRALDAPEICWDSFDVGGGQCIDLEINEDSFEPDNSVYTVTVNVNPDTTDYSVTWIVERPGHDGPLIAVTTEGTDRDTVDLSEHGYTYEDGDRLHAQAISDNQEFDPNAVCVDVLERAAGQCVDLDIDQDEFTEDNSQYSVTVDVEPDDEDYRVRWTVFRDGEPNPVLDVTTEGAAVNEIDLDDYSTYTYEEGDTLHVEAIDINDPNNNCIDELVAELGECLDLYLDQDEFEIEDPTYNVNVETDPSNAEYDVLWTIERDGDTELEVVTEGDFLDLRDYSNYTPEAGDSLRAQAIAIDDPDNLCIDEIDSQTPEGECLDLDIEQNRFDPSEDEYSVDVETDPDGEYYRVEWTVERDGDFVFRARLSDDEIDFDDYPGFDAEFGDTLEARAIDISDPDDVCIDAISSPIEEGECIDLNFNQSEFNVSDSTYSVDVEVDPDSAAYRVEWTVHRGRDTVLRVRTRRDYVDLSDYPGYWNSAQPGDVLRARAIDIEDPDNECRDVLESEEEVCREFELDRNTFSRTSDQEICVDYTDWPYFDELRYRIDGHDEGYVNVDESLCFILEEEDVRNASDIEIWIDGFYQDCRDDLEYKERPPRFDKRVTDTAPSNYTHRAVTDWVGGDVDYIINYEHSNANEQTVVITDTIGRNGGYIQGYIKNNRGEILGESGSLDYNNDMEINVPECDGEDYDSDSDFCYEGDIGDEDGVTVYNVPDSREIIIRYSAEINSEVDPKECSDPTSAFNRLGYCGEIYDNTSDFVDDTDNGARSTEVYIPCPYIVIRAGGDVFLENPFDYGVDTLVCAEIANVPETIIEPEPPKPEELEKTGGENTIIPVMDHRLCQQQGEMSPEGYRGIDKLSSLICEVSLEVSEELTQAAIVQNINTNKERIARYDKNLNLSTGWNKNITGDSSDALPKSNNNVYYKDDGDLHFDNGAADVVFTKGARTFIVEGHDVYIDSNIRYEDASLADPRDIPSIAIIVIGGNIVIADEVSETTGVFFVQEDPKRGVGGQICEEPVDPANLCDEDAEADVREAYNSKRYTQFGSIYGDLQHLFKFRTAAGDPRFEEGAVVIRFDNRVFLNTPPILNELVQLSISEAAL